MHVPAHIIVTSSMAAELGTQVPEDSIIMETNMRMCSGGPGVDQELPEGLIRLLEGYLIKEENRNA